MKKENKKRILFYIERFYPINGGAENSALRLAKALVKNGYKVSVLTRRYDEKLSTIETIEGVKIERVNSGIGKLGTIDFFMKSWLYLKMNRKDFDVLHMHGINIFSGLLAKAAKPKMSIIKTTTEKDMDAVANYPIFGGLFLEALMNIDKFVCISKALETEVKSYLPEANTINIPNGIDIENWRK
jgi:glycosyltransferase involved in cell wall biosynthesis